MLHKFIFTKTKAKVWIKLYLPEKNTFPLYIKTKWQNDKTTHSPLQKVQNNGTHRSRFIKTKAKVWINSARQEKYILPIYKDKMTKWQNYSQYVVVSAKQWHPKKQKRF